MNHTPFDIPVLLLLFNRPHYAREVILALKAVQPSAVYVAVDGPRPEHPQDVANIESCLRLLDLIDWPCHLAILKREKNEGCGLAVSGAITWFFGQVTMGIILEDDCVPCPAFFSFCKEMLFRYEHDERIMHITGTRWNEDFPIRQSYFFSAIGHVWGWATWQRAWQKYDFTMREWPQQREACLIEKIFSDQKHVLYWKSNFDTMHRLANKHTWDYQWQYTLFLNGGLAVTPQKNLVQNIGSEGVHDSRPEAHRHRRHIHADFQVGDLVTPVRRHYGFDTYNMNHYFLRKDPLWMRVKRRVRHFSKLFSIA